MSVARMFMPLSLPSWLSADVWPFETEAIDFEGTSIAVSQAGRGPTLLFYTGIGSVVWRDLVLRLSRHFRCVVADPPGIGLSGPSDRTGTTLAQSTRAVGAVLQALEPDDVTLVVHDSGGPPAFAAAARAPRQIQGIVAVNTFGWRPDGAAFRGMLAVMGSRAIKNLSVSTHVLAAVTATTVGAGRRLDATSRRAYRACFQHGMKAFHDYLRDARHSDALYDEVARGFAGPLRGLPVLTVFGERNDPLGFQPTWKALFPDARQIVVRNGNHFPMCDDPDGVADHIARWHREHVSERTAAAGVARR